MPSLNNPLKIAILLPLALVVLRHLVLNYTGADVPLLLASCDASARETMASYRRGKIEREREFVVLITGASRGGVGEALAREYAKRNASLILTARREKELRETAKACEELGARRVVVLAGDISAKDEPARVAAAIAKEFPASGLNVAVVNHALIPAKLFYDMRSDEDLENEYFRTFDVNVRASISLVRRLIPLLERGTVVSGVKSSLVGIGTMGTYMGSAVIYLGAYLMSKAALQAFFDNLRTEREILGQDASLSVQFEVLNEIASTIYLESKYGVKNVDEIGTAKGERQEAKVGELSVFARAFGKVYAAVQPPPISLEECARAIACRVDRQLSNTFVPTYGYWLTWLLGGDATRAFWAYFGFGYISNKPHLLERVVEARGEIIASRI